MCRGVAFFLRAISSSVVVSGGGGVRIEITVEPAANRRQRNAQLDDVERRITDSLEVKLKNWTRVIWGFVVASSWKCSKKSINFLISNGNNNWLAEISLHCIVKNQTVKCVHADVLVCVDKLRNVPDWKIMQKSAIDAHMSAIFKFNSLEAHSLLVNLAFSKCTKSHSTFLHSKSHTHDLSIAMSLWIFKITKRNAQYIQDMQDKVSTARQHMRERRSSWSS